ncbi:hypothetical protein [Vibrio gallaecicus]|nr:hypothetical protein [Vibrio gallaecicus]MDN3614878.1 hypothetical protein [Vibrio gallaecicus]
MQPFKVSDYSLLVTINGEQQFKIGNNTLAMANKKGGTVMTTL